MRSITCQYLRTGHTHEDVDQLFGTLSKYMLKVRDLQCPADLVKAITDFLVNAKMPFEAERYVVTMDDMRDW